MRGLLMMSAIVTTMSSTAFAQGQPRGGWWEGWGLGPGYGMWPDGQRMMPRGYGDGPGWAGPGWGSGMMSQGMGMGGANMMMTPIDADQDGAISAEEAAAHAEFMFEAMDADQDDVLVAGELGGGRRDMMRMMHPEMSAAMEERHAAQFSAKDGDGDGKITMAEFLAAEKIQYQAADSDGDGRVTPWELRGQMWQ
jgi:EF hand